MRNRLTAIVLTVLIIVLLGFITGKLITTNPSGVTVADQLPTPAFIPTLEIAPTPTIFPIPPPIEEVIAIPLPTKVVYPEATAEEQQAFAEEVKDVTFTTNWTEDTDAIIRLDSDPRVISINNSLSVLASKRDESVTILFKYKMNRASVDIKRITSEDPERVYPKQISHWVNDRQLHVKILLSQIEVRAYTSYFINLSDALTQNGDSIQQPSFAVTIIEPSQWWQLAIDSLRTTQLTSFEIPYLITNVDREGRYLKLSRTIDYCGCDRFSPALNSIYDTITGKQVDYPIETQLTSNYSDSGSFVADRRGFFMKSRIIQMLWFQQVIRL